MVGSPTRLQSGRLPWQAVGLSEPLAEGIHKDTDGPDETSDGVQYFAHFPGRYLAPADFRVPAFRLGTALTSFPGPPSPARRTGDPREDLEEGDNYYACPF